MKRTVYFFVTTLVFCLVSVLFPYQLEGATPVHDATLAEPPGSNQVIVVPATNLLAPVAPKQKSVSSAKKASSTTSVPKSIPKPVPQPQKLAAALPQATGPIAPALHEQTLATLARLHAQYAIDITIQVPAHPEMSFLQWQPVTEADSQALHDFVVVLNQELSKYSPEFVTRSQLKAIFLVKNLVVDGQAMAALPEAVVDDALYFDVGSQYLLSDNGQYMHHVIHHEYDHVIEYNLYGTYTAADASWVSCNADGFTYGAGGFSAYLDGSFVNSFHPEAGFISRYATLAIEEDKAELFSWLMTDKTAVNNLLPSDSSLACKVTSMNASYGVF